MDNVFVIGKDIYRGGFASGDNYIEFAVHSTYPDKHHKVTVSIRDLKTQKWVDAKIFYDSVANCCVEDWVLKHFRPELNVKLEPINWAVKGE